jgi:hypothetical protein
MINICWCGPIFPPPRRPSAAAPVPHLKARESPPAALMLVDLGYQSVIAAARSRDGDPLTCRNAVT